MVRLQRVKLDSYVQNSDAGLLIVDGQNVLVNRNKDVSLRSAGLDRVRGSIYIHTGLLAALMNEAQLAGVLGHEIAHATHEHDVRSFKRQMWTNLIVGLAGVALSEATKNKPVASILSGLGLGLTVSAIVNGYGRNFEDQADRVGLRYLYEAKYDPLEAPKVWEIFTRKTGDQNSVVNFFYGSHSTHRARKRNLVEQISQTYFDRIDCSSPCEFILNEEIYKKNVLEQLEKTEHSNPN